VLARAITDRGRFARGPVLLAENLGSTGDLISTNGNLYFLDDSAVKAVPLSATGVVTPVNVVNSNPDGAGGLITDGTYLFAATRTYTGGPIWRADPNGVNQSRTTVVNPGSGSTLVGFSDTHILYDTGFESGQIYRVPKTGGTPVAHNSNGNLWARSRDFDDQYIYYQDLRQYIGGVNNFYRTDVDTGATIKIRDGVADENPIWVGENYVFYSGFNNGNTLEYSAKDGTGLTTLLTGVTQVGWGDSVDGWVYYYDDPSSSIARINLADSTIEPLVTVDHADVRDILVVDDMLYYLESGLGAGQQRLYAFDMNPQTIPEPTSLVLLSLAGLALLGFTRRRR
jgi:hypothetical protein